MNILKEHVNAAMSACACTFKTSQQGSIALLVSVGVGIFAATIISMKQLRGHQKVEHLKKSQYAAKLQRANEANFVFLEGLLSFDQSGHRIISPPTPSGKAASLNASISSGAPWSYDDGNIKLKLPFGKKEFLNRMRGQMNSILGSDAISSILAMTSPTPFASGYGVEEILVTAKSSLVLKGREFSQVNRAKLKLDAPTPYCEVENLRSPSAPQTEPVTILFNCQQAYRGVLADVDNSSLDRRFGSIEPTEFLAEVMNETWTVPGTYEILPTAMGVDDVTQWEGAPITFTIIPEPECVTTATRLGSGGSSDPYQVKLSCRQVQEGFLAEMPSGPEHSSGLVSPTSAWAEVLSFTWSVPGTYSIVPSALGIDGVAQWKGDPIDFEITSEPPFCTAIGERLNSGLSNDPYRIKLSCRHVQNGRLAELPSGPNHGSGPVSPGSTLTEIVNFTWSQPGTYSIQPSALGDDGSTWNSVPINFTIDAPVLADPCNNPAAVLTTRNISINFPAIGPGCTWTDSDVRVYGGYRYDTKTWSVPESNAEICSMNLRASQSVRFDDVMLITVNGYALATSDSTVFDYLSSSDQYKYSWNRIKGKGYDGKKAIPYCVGSGPCHFPMTDTNGPFYFNFNHNVLKSRLGAASNSLQFRTYVFGDNEKKRDCQHSGFSLQMEVVYYAP